MALLDFWESNPAIVLNQTIVQVTTNAGDGNLLDHSKTSSELREFFKLVPTGKLADYVKTCLTQAFTNSGLVLQDLVNELGRRLGYQVTNGLYRGRQNAIGFDGIWKHPGSRDMVIEVKTTDYYTINLDKIFTYRSKLEQEGGISREAGVLFVVGRDDSNSLEAQIRGSRYAWDARLVSVEALIKLVQVKEAAGDIATVERIRTLLEPIEYTRIDRLVDVVFEAVSDVQEAADLETEGVAADTTVPGAAIVPEAGGQIRTDTDEIALVRSKIVEALNKRFRCDLLRETKALYSTQDGKHRVCISFSKRYARSDQTHYWYAYHPKQNDFLGEAESGHLILACADKSQCYAVPLEIVRSVLDKLNQTTGKDRAYWHVYLTEKTGEMVWDLKHVGKKLSIEKYKLAF